MSASRRLLAALLRWTGKAYEPSPELPAALVGHTLRRRSVDLVRGLVRLRAPVFVGARVAIRGKRGLHFGRFVTVERGCSLDGYARAGVWLGSGSKLGAGTVVSCTTQLARVTSADTFRIARGKPSISSGASSGSLSYTRQ